jgi:hypothetical protein
MRILRRKQRDKHPTREARVVGGPHNGLLVPVTEKDGDFVFPEVMDFDISHYTFDPEAWEFRYAPSA